MRFGWLAGLAIATGSAIGVGLTRYEVGQSADRFDVRTGQTASAPKDAKQEGAPKVFVVSGEVNDYGTMGHNQKGTHSFSLRNDGTAPLNVSLSNLSCGQCVATEFTSKTIQPNEKAEIAVTFTTRKPGPKFSETVELGTNDPRREIVSLAIHGFVTTAVRASVEELALGDISANATNKGGFRIYGYLGNRLEILGNELSNPESADRFETSIKTLEPSELAEDPRARVGYAVSLTIKPGLPLGPISQTIRITTQADTKTTVEVPIRGTVISDVSLIGNRRLRAETNTLYLGTVPRATGTTTTLRVLVKGPYSENVEVRVGEIDPAGVLRATVGEAVRFGDGQGRTFPLTVEVVKNAPAINRLGTDQAKAGRINLDTTHPFAKRIQLLVNFATE